MVSHKHKCIFVHIPKTAGMSIENSFIKGLNLRLFAGQCHPLLLTYNKDQNYGPQTLAHLSAKDYTKYSYITEKQFTDYFKFTFIRNPYDRILSIYKHFQYHRYISFDTFLEYEFPILEKNRYYFIKPQYEYIFDINDKKLVDFIGRFESLQKDFDKIFNNMLLPIGDLEKINISKTEFKKYSKGNIKFIYNKLKEKPYLLKSLRISVEENLIKKEEISNASKQFIETFYKKDFEAFGYEFLRDLK